MASYVGCCGLLGIAVFIALLFLRRRKIENEMADFYKTHSLYVAKDEPPNVRESLDAGSDNLYCCRTNLTTATGSNIEFCWWEWYLKSNTTINGAPSVSFTHYLAVSFAPHSVSEEFMREAIDWADKSGDDVSQKAKDFFITNTETPYRAEMLADGTLIICWRTVIKRREVYEAKIEWLKNNLSLPNEIETSETIFYTHENYSTLRRKFNAAWTNLELELHHQSAKFQHEGRDEFGGDAAFGDPHCPNEIAFALTGETTVKKARQMFSDAYGGAADILRGQRAAEENDSLAAANELSNLED